MYISSISKKKEICQAKIFIDLPPYLKESLEAYFWVSFGILKITELP